jgi:SsrA-binding protein
LRAGKANLKDSYARIDNGELMLHNMHISPYEQGNRFNHEPLRTRKLLMHRYEINKLVGQTREKGYTLTPLKLYFSKGKVKVELALTTGKKNYDKRNDMAEKDAKREIDRHMRDKQKDF